MKPVAAAVAGALISGVAMYTVGARTATVDAFTQTPAVVQTADAQYAPGIQLVSSTGRARPAAAQPVAARSTRVTRSAPAPRRTVYRDVEPDRERVYTEEDRETRSWQKTAMIIGGSAASGAGVGAIMDGKKGAAIGAAIGGGAASIYEATRRR
jgi:hypothetical protein